MTDRAASLRKGLVADLVAEGTLRSPEWQEAFAEVPRHLFLPRFFRQSDDLTGWEAIDRTHPDWLSLVYANATWVTQLDHDDRWEVVRQDRCAWGVPTSSSTAPGLMALMLEALGVGDQHRVLEIGAATGYNAALLCHRLGSAQVSSVEYDPILARRARAALKRAGYVPTLVASDGANGYSAGVPYDRVIATCSFPTVPHAWIEQTRAGGLILTNLHRDLGGGALVRLTVTEDGTASGHILRDYGAFMPTRTYQVRDTQALLDHALRQPDGERRDAILTTETLEHPDFELFAAMLLPDVATIGFDPGTGHQHWLLTSDGGWAYLDTAAGIIEQQQTARLWDRVEGFYERWRDLGSPARDRLGLTVSSSGEHVLWLDEPDNPVAQL